MDMPDNLGRVFDGVVRGDRTEVEQAVIQALESNTRPELILTQSLVPAMDEVGRRFEACEFYVPEMLASARAMKAGLTILKPNLVQSGADTGPRVVMGTVQGDLHDIGKSLVGMMLEGAGFEVQDLGTDVSPARFVEAVGQTQPAVVGLSALLTTTMPQMQATITALDAAGLRDKVRIIVGGAPVTESFARSIGADGSAADASRAVALVRSLLAG
jgi:5-methyltetrahydrofolate--homocysteine methyltransferase